MEDGWRGDSEGLGHLYRKRNRNPWRPGGHSPAHLPARGRYSRLARDPAPLSLSAGSATDRPDEAGGLRRIARWLSGEVARGAGAVSGGESHHILTRRRPYE